tara:strand:- start:357 stop:581 length:225 start_codon:yes stop_codon:yes gene_type:complete
MGHYSKVSDLKTYDNFNAELNEQPLHELQMLLMSKQELSLRYIQLMNDAQKILGREEAINLINESKVIWEKLSS